MAKRKTQIEGIDEALSTTAETAGGAIEKEQTLGVTESAKASKSTDSPTIEAKIKSKKVATEDIPDNVVAILKTFSNYPELLVTSHGCVYTPECKLDAAKVAILYKNPFYNT